MSLKAHFSNFTSDSWWLNHLFHAFLSLIFSLPAVRPYNYYYRTINYCEAIKYLKYISWITFKILPILVGKNSKTHSIDLVRCRLLYGFSSVQVELLAKFILWSLVLWSASAIVTIHHLGQCSNHILTISIKSDDFRSWSHVLSFVGCVCFGWAW